MEKKVSSDEVLICQSVLGANYKEGEVRSLAVFSANPYSSQTPFALKEMSVPLEGFPNQGVICVQRRYRPGTGQELESVDVYDYLNGVFMVVLKLKKGSTGSPRSEADLFRFAMGRPQIAG